MDKDLLRLVIIASGALVFVFVLIWGLVRRKSSSTFAGRGNPLDHIDSSLAVDLSEDEYEIVPISTHQKDEPRVQFPQTEDEIPEISTELKEESQSGFLFEDFDDEQVPDFSIPKENEPANAAVSQDSMEIPTLIQFSLQANNDNGFNGLELFNHLQASGLVYGDLQIFERLDAMNRVDYAVASMVNPGTFPDEDQHMFFCPGITFFMQPKVLDDPLTVFDEMLGLIYALQKKLNGAILDDDRLPVEEQRIVNLRNSLK